MVTNISYSYNPYSTMSMEEACSQMMADTTEILNELQMNILLTEYEYLRENGEEIDYTNEAGKLDSIKDKFINAIKEVARKLSDLYDKCMSWIKDRAETAMDFVLHRIGNVKAYKKALNYMMNNIGSITVPNVKSIVDFRKLNNDIVGIFNNPFDSDKNPKDIISTYVIKLERNSQVLVTPQFVMDAILLLDSGKEYLNDIRNIKKHALSEVKKIEKRVMDANSNFHISKEPDGDDAERMNDSKTNETLDLVNKYIKAINKISHDVIKIYHTHIMNIIYIMTAIINYINVNKLLNKIPKYKKN